MHEPPFRKILLAGWARHTLFRGKPGLYGAASNTLGVFTKGVIVVYVPMQSMLQTRLEVERSYETISDQDLKRLASIAVDDRATFVLQYPHHKKATVLCIALCQGAAWHYIGSYIGIKDFDVWTFYTREILVPDFPSRRIKQYDFGLSKFGKHPADKGYLGRRVDILGRSINSTGGDPTKSIQEYLSAGRTKSARFLATKAVVLLAPDYLRGTTIWPLERHQLSRH